MDAGDLNASSAGGSMSLNASIRERLRSKVRGRQVHIAACIVNDMYGSASPVKIPETIAGHISAPVPLFFLNWRFEDLDSLVKRRNPK